MAGADSRLVDCRDSEPETAAEEPAAARRDGSGDAPRPENESMAADRAPRADWADREETSLALGATTITMLKKEKNHPLGNAPVSHPVRTVGAGLGHVKRGKRWRRTAPHGSGQVFGG